jgi:galactosylceramidase
MNRYLFLTTAYLFVMSTASQQHAVAVETITLNGEAGGKRFEGIGLVNGGGATSVLLKDYPEPQRSQILDLVYKPKFGASISALLVEIPGDGNSTQGSMPSHMHARDDLDYSRGYTWWILREAKKRNPKISLDGAAWSAPGWIGNGQFWSQDAADYYVKWLQGLRDVYGLELDALGCRNEKRVSVSFAKKLRKTLDSAGFDQVRIHAFDNWSDWKFDFIEDMARDEELRDAIDIIGAHVMYAKPRAHASRKVKQLASEMGKPIWNTEDHVYLKGFDCQISIVECFNDNFIHSHATRIVNWYDIAGVYPMEPYSNDPATVLAHWPWSGHYQVREALWGYAHYGQFTEVGWEYLSGACGELEGGGTYVTLKSPENDYSIIIETKDAKAPQQVRFAVGKGLSPNDLCVWRSNKAEQFIHASTIKPENGEFLLTLEPMTIYSLSTTTRQQKGSFDNIPPAARFPFPYYETFESYNAPEQWGHLPRYLADIDDVFELAECPDGRGRCLRQVIPRQPNSWAPSWQPYTIVGDEHWTDYAVSADVYLTPGDTAGVMGRVNHVGTGFGCIPKGYYLQLGHDGVCSLIVVHGETKKRQMLGDAEQQALVKSHKDGFEDGQKVLAEVQLSMIEPNQWHHLELRFAGAKIAAIVDEKPVLSVDDDNHSHGMAGLMAARREGNQLSMPYYDNLLVKTVGGPVPRPTRPAPTHLPIYGPKSHQTQGQQISANLMNNVNDNQDSTVAASDTCTTEVASGVD